MEWYEIVLTVIGIGGFLSVMIKLFLNKLMTKVDSVIKTVETLSLQMQIIGAKADATHAANEKHYGNGYTVTWNDAYERKLKEIGIMKE